MHGQWQLVGIHKQIVAGSPHVQGGEWRKLGHQDCSFFSFIFGKNKEIHETLVKF